LKPPVKIYLLAGEASGDLHGSNLVKSLKTYRPDADIRGWGGDAMAKAGAVISKHIRELAFMGFAEVVANLPAILNNFKFCKKDILEFQPDVVVLIDYPGFNLRMAKWLRKQGIRTIYYIAPQVWAWKESRVSIIREKVDVLLSILPFEPAFFDRHQIKTHYVGHPLLEAVQYFKQDHKTPSTTPQRAIIALLPGSRKQEIRTHLPTMLHLSQLFRQYDFHIAGAPAQDELIYKETIKSTLGFHPENVKVQFSKTYELLHAAKAAIVCSGTATLETALFKVPQVVCYRGHMISYFIARLLIKVKYISLVNLILDRPFLKELIQKEFTVSRLAEELNRITLPKEQVIFKETYDELENLLTMDGFASDKAAQIILETFPHREV